MMRNEQVARNAEINRRNDEGESISALARDYGLSPTRIKQILNPDRFKARQRRRYAAKRERDRIEVGL